MVRAPWSLLVLCFAAVAFAAEPPQARNGKIETVARSGTLESQVRSLGQSGPAWAAYAAPLIAGQHQMCCFDFDKARKDYCCGGCRLEGGKGAFIHGEMNGCHTPTRDEFYVLVRTDHGQITEVRSLGLDCALDLGERTLYWLGAVPADESIGFLEKLASANDELGRKRPEEEALMAIAMHRAASADAALDGLVAAGRPSWLRKQAAFWIGSARGQHGFETLRKLIAEEPSSGLRKEFLFPLSQNDAPGAQDELIRIARHDPDSEVRGEALFWLAQKAGEKVAGVVGDAVDRDPDSEVRKKAVFALSQMESGEGVPLLIHYAKTHRDPVVRKEAVFWLGQSDDPRALDFIVGLLR